MITYLVKNGNMLFRVSEINIKYAQEKPSEKKKGTFSHTIVILLYISYSFLGSQAGVVDIKHAFHLYYKCCMWIEFWVNIINYYFINAWDLDLLLHWFLILENAHRCHTAKVSHVKWISILHRGQGCSNMLRCFTLTCVCHSLKNHFMTVNSQLVNKDD